MKEIIPGVGCEINAVEDTISLIVDIDPVKFMDAGVYEKYNYPDAPTRFYSIQDLLEDMDDNEIIDKSIDYLVDKYQANKKIELRYTQLMFKAKDRIKEVESTKFADIFPEDAKKIVSRYWVLIGRLQKRKLKELKR